VYRLLPLERKLVAHVAKSLVVSLSPLLAATKAGPSSNTLYALVEVHCLEGWLCWHQVKILTGTWKVCSQFCFTDASVNTNISFLELSLLSGSVRSTLAVHHGDTGRRELNMFSLQFGGWNLHDNVENRVQTISSNSLFDQFLLHYGTPHSLWWH
jgi:hypothetical protein